MFEHTGAPGQSPTEPGMSPVPSGSTSPNPANVSNGSPGTSPMGKQCLDFKIQMLWFPAQNLFYS